MDVLTPPPSQSHDRITHYPRIADLLERMREERASHRHSSPEQVRATASEHANPMQHVINDLDAAAVDVLPVGMAMHPAIAPTAVETTPAQPVAADSPISFEELGMSELAREALRARLVAIAHQRHHRSAYEIIFLMLAFAVTVLLTAPPLIQVLLAAHGTRP